MTKLARILTAIAALSVLTMLVLGVVRYSTLLETIMRDPRVSEWQGPAGFRVGESPRCGEAPCWAAADAKAVGDGWEAVDVPRAYLKEKLRGVKEPSHAYYRFSVTIPESLRVDNEAVAFSPNWIVHRSYNLYVDGHWVGSGHGVTSTGDIVYQKVIVPLPEQAVKAGHATVVVEATVGPADLGIQHLGRVLVGPSVVLNRLHAQAEFAMGSFYLLFVAAEGAIFVFFALFYLLARTRKGFGAFVAYSFMMTAIHLAIGNFLEGVIPLAARIWLYFAAKAGASALLGLILGRVLWRDKLAKGWVALATLPAVVTLVMLLDFSYGTHSANIANMHVAANATMSAVVFGFVAIVARRRSRGVRLEFSLFSCAYAIFLGWNFFVHRGQDFDYRPLADLFFFYFVAWMTVAEFGLAQARAGMLESNFRRLHEILGKLTGRGLATHLVTKGSEQDRRQVECSMLAVDMRFTQRLIQRHGVDATLAAVDHFLSLVAKAVEAHGGEVNKIMGDKALAVWGLLAADPVGAQRAASAALTLRESVRLWSDERRKSGLFPIGWSGGVATGPVTAGRVGDGERSDYSVFGEAVGRAFELLQNAKGTMMDVLVDETTLERLGEKALARPFEISNGGQAYALVAMTENGGRRDYDLPATQDVFVPNDDAKEAA